MMNRTMMLIILAATLAGCAAATNLYSAAPQRGRTAQQAQADAVACEKVAYDVKEKPHISSGSLLGWWIDESAYKREYRACMTGRGYTLKEE